MNEFASTADSGLLKDTYGQTGLTDALKRRRQKLAQTKGIGATEGEEEDEE